MQTKKTLKAPPRDSSGMSPVERSLVQHIMLGLGIVPIEDPKLDYRRAIEAMSAEDARRFKRKFRKMWRKLMKKDVVEAQARSRSPGLGSPSTSAEESKRIADAVRNPYGAGKSIPSRNERFARKKKVFDHVWTTTIAPMISNMENPDDPNKASR